LEESKDVEEAEEIVPEEAALEAEESALEESVLEEIGLEEIDLVARNKPHLGEGEGEVSIAWAVLEMEEGVSCA